MKRRKIASLLLSVLMLAALALSAMAGHTIGQEASCPHLKKDRVVQSIDYSPLNSEEHSVYTTYRVSCAVCNAYLEDDTVVSTGTHSLRDSGNHHNSNGKHTYTQTCSLCGYSRSSTYSCSGPPCREPFRVG